MADAEIAPRLFTNKSAPPDARQRARPVKKPLTIEEMHEIARSRGGTCLSETYVSSKLRWRCAQGHEWEATPNNVKDTLKNSATPIVDRGKSIA